ncbi:unnamed protein product [Rhizoctonia solani]|uniref:DNA/RNA-binding protein Kin17 WH-like domain-containing protein n=1 Tax=Rhizoctonia solani TaxID=456999 RepID=A0A8H3H778_9AGAM|nr:unnamed protein product [Rhizoctonia solani]
MPRAEVGTPKYLANAMKSKGLQRLLWVRLRVDAQMLVVGENAGRHISDFSGQFQSEFVTLLSRRFGTKRVRANQVYQEYIQDKHHLHMNATRWVTLAGFCKHLGRAGIAHVDETEKGWFIAWIDNTPKALAKADAARKKERATTSDEQRERNLIAEQIERAREAGAQDDEDAAESSAQGLQRDEGEKLVLSFGAKKQSPPAEETKSEDEVKVKVEGEESAPAPAPSASSSVKPINVFKPGNAFKPGANPLKAGNALKSGNVFKAAKPAGSATDAPKKRPMSAAEALIFEEQERKRRRMEKNHAN